MEHPWLYARCQQIEANPDGHLDLWARYHYKSTIQTFAKTIQDILSSHGTDPDPKWNGVEQTFCIFSHTRPIAKAFLRQIRDELSSNLRLQELFPDVLYAQPEKNSPRWSEDSGLLVKRQSTPREATVEAWGLVDGQPTSKHFNVLIYDDIVTPASVTNADQVYKTTQAWELSFALGDSNPKQRMAARAMPLRIPTTTSWSAALPRLAFSQPRMTAHSRAIQCCSRQKRSARRSKSWGRIPFRVRCS